jgi:hypothetical protein
MVADGRLKDQGRSVAKGKLVDALGRYGGANLWCHFDLVQMNQVGEAAAES